MARGPELTIDIRRKQFAGADGPLFEDFHLSVASGSIVVIVGPSGVGKSSLLRLIAGIDREAEAAVRLDGRSAELLPPAGFVFQDARLLPWLTSIDNILAVQPQIGREAALAVLASVGLADSAELYPHALSGGMQRRVALARALAVNPGFLLLDEPFVSLDRSLIRELQMLFSHRIAEAQSTALVVTHMPEDAAVLADRVIVLKGRPVKIAADFLLPGPRQDRDPERLLELTRRIEREVGAT